MHTFIITTKKTCIKAYYKTLIADVSINIFINTFAHWGTFTVDLQKYVCRVRSKKIFIYL